MKEDIIILYSRGCRQGYYGSYSKSAPKPKADMLCNVAFDKLLYSSDIAHFVEKRVAEVVSKSLNVYVI